MTQRQTFILKATVVALAAFAAGAAFSAYLQPALLIEFANLVLCS